MATGARCIPDSTVLANEGAVFIELDLHALAAASQAVVAAQLALATQRGLTARMLLVIVTETEVGKALHVATMQACSRDK